MQRISTARRVSQVFLWVLPTSNSHVGVSTGWSQTVHSCVGHSSSLNRVIIYLTDCRMDCTVTGQCVSIDTMEDSVKVPDAWPHETQAGKLASVCLHKRHYGYASGHAGVSTKPPRLLRLSLVRALLREMRSLLWRIGEIRSRQLDQQGISVNPLQKSYPAMARERALDDCNRDMRNLYISRRYTTLIEAEIFAQGWSYGAAWGLRNSDIQPRV